MGKANWSIIYANIHKHTNTHTLPKLNKARKSRGLKLLNLPFWSIEQTISSVSNHRGEQELPSFWNQKHLVLGCNHHSWPQYRQAKSTLSFWCAWYVRQTELRAGR